MLCLSWTVRSERFGWNFFSSHLNFNWIKKRLLKKLLHITRNKVLWERKKVIFSFCRMLSLFLFTWNSQVRGVSVWKRWSEKIIVPREIFSFTSWSRVEENTEHCEVEKVKIRDERALDSCRKLFNCAWGAPRKFIIEIYRWEKFRKTTKLF